MGTGSSSSPSRPGKRTEASGSISLAIYVNALVKSSRAFSRREKGSGVAVGNGRIMLESREDGIYERTLQAKVIMILKKLHKRTLSVVVTN